MKLYLLTLILLTPCINHCMEKEDKEIEKKDKRPVLSPEASELLVDFAELFNLMIKNFKETHNNSPKEPEVNYSLVPLPFSDQTNQRIKEELTTLIKIGSELSNAADNGMLTIIKSIYQELETDHLNNWHNKKENALAKKIHQGIIHCLLRKNVKKINEIKEAEIKRKETLSNKLRVKLIFNIIGIFRAATGIQLIKRPTSSWDKWRLERLLTYSNQALFDQAILTLNSDLEPTIKKSQLVMSAFLCFADINQRFFPLV